MHDNVSRRDRFAQVSAYAGPGSAAKFRDRLSAAGYAVVASSEADGEWCRLTLGTMDQMLGFEMVLPMASSAGT